MRKRRSVERHYVFFTLNGKFLGAAFCCHGLDSVLPFVAFQDYVLPVRINFGKQPFVFDLNTLCEDDIIERCKVSSSERVLDEGPDSDDDDSILSQDSDDDSDRTDHTPEFSCSDEDEEDDRDWVCDCGDSECENSIRPPPHRRRTDWESDSEDGDRYWCEDCQTYHYRDRDDDEEEEGVVGLDFEDMMRIALIESMKDAVARRQAEEEEEKEEEEEDERMEGVPTPREGETIRFRSKPTSE